MKHLNLPARDEGARSALAPGPESKQEELSPPDGILHASRFQVDLTDRSPDRVVSLELRHNLFLVEQDHSK